MNHIEKIKKLKKLIIKGDINRLDAIDQLNNLIKSNDVSEKEVFLSEIKKLKNFKDIKLETLRKLNEKNQNSNDIIKFLSLSDDKIREIKINGYRLI